MSASPNPYAGARPASSAGASAPHPVLPFGRPIDVDCRGMIATWYEHDLSAWEKRTGRRVSVRAEGDDSRIAWRIDGRRVASTDLSDVVYGRMDLENAVARMAA